MNNQNCMLVNNPTEYKFNLRGRICNCKFLNVRERPAPESKILQVLNEESVFYVSSTFHDYDNPNKEWVTVANENGEVIGYVMRKYIRVRGLLR